MEAKTVLAVFVLLFKGPLMILGFLFRHRILLIGAGILVVVLVAVPMIRHATTPAPKPGATAAEQVPAYQQVTPDATLAPWVLRTPSRVYYVAQYQDLVMEKDNLTVDAITLVRFYDYTRKKWQLETTPLALDIATQGRIQMVKR